MADNKWKIFIDTALSHVGEGKQWVEQVLGRHYNAWCAAFVSACARVSGISAKILFNDKTNEYDILHPGIIVESGTCWYMAKAGTENNCGIWMDGPYLGSYPKPLPGDLILFHWRGRNDRKWAGKYESYHIGIIYNVINDTIYTVEGNSARGKGPKYATVRTLQYRTDYMCIQGYYRPNWQKVGAYVEGINFDGSGYGGIDNTLPYIPQKSRNDPIIREVGYLNAQYKPSTIAKGLKLSAVDYLSPIGPIFNQFMSGPGYQAILDRLSNIIRVIISYFSEHGFNTAVCTGIVANMLHESGLNAAKESADGSRCGICQWQDARKFNMISYVGTDWRINLSKQLEFIWVELGISFVDLLINLTRLDNSERTVAVATELFAKIYLNIQDSEAIKQRQISAYEIWHQIVIQYIGDNSEPIILPHPRRPEQIIGED